jgi:hypothetical protein
LADDPKWELALLATVQGFYQRLLGEQFGEDLPVPSAVALESIRHSGDVRETLRRLHIWIRLLDTAVTPAMLRLGTCDDLDPEVAEALLRYFVRHRDDSGSNRDKTDLIATFLFRHPRVPGQWERRGYGLDGSIPLSPFEIALLEILSESDVPELPEEHAQLLREFGPLLDQANRFQDFPALMDSGIIPRVRELKASLGQSIYHPGVLATIAPYNCAFGNRFQDLFAAASKEIKEFAQQLEELGGTILSTVDGVEVTVEHVAALDEKSLISADYSVALEKFRRISRLKRELERRPPIRRATVPSPPRGYRSAQTAGAAAAAAPAVEQKYVPVTITPQLLAVEEAKIRRVEESIRIFVRVADPKFRQIVPMRYFNLMLSPAEIDAYTADYLEETSPRADIARMLLRIVAVTARMGTEIEEIKRAQNSRSVWKLHADSLVVLMDLAKHLPEAIAQLVSKLGDERQQHETLQASLEKLRDRSTQATSLVG